MTTTTVPALASAAMTGGMTTARNHRSVSPNTSVRGLLFGGCMVIALGMGGMTAWAALAPLHSAVVAAGALAPETGRKVVRHQEGGPIAEVLVNGGDQVTAGQVLIRLDRTEAQTRLDVLTAQWLDALALEARLSAELLDKPEITWPPDLLSRRNANLGVTKMMANQQTLFDVRKAQLAAEDALVVERIGTLDQEAKSLVEQQRFTQREITLIQEELRITEGLLARGNATRPKLVEQQREEARLRGRDRELEAEIAKSRHQAAEAKGDQIRRRSDFREKVLVDLEKARGEVARLGEQILDAANRLASRDIKAPDAGTVVMHGHHTAGGTIAPNEPVLDIVPEERELLAEVKIQPKDIKSVSIGLPVKVQLTAYDSRVVGSLDGEVKYVSADRLTDQPTNQEYYLARVRLVDSDPHQVHNLKIRPGMPVEARILMSARTPLDYLLAPLSHSYLKAFIQE